MSIQGITNILVWFDQIKTNPRVFLGTIDPRETDFGFRVLRNTCGAFNVVWDRTLYQQVIEERGWTYTAMGVLPSLLETHMTEWEMTQELIRIEMLVWKQIQERFLAGAG